MQVISIGAIGGDKNKKVRGDPTAAGTVQLFVGPETTVVGQSKAF